MDPISYLSACVPQSSQVVNNLEDHMRLAQISGYTFAEVVGSPKGGLPGGVVHQHPPVCFSGGRHIERVFTKEQNKRTEHPKRRI